MLTCFVGPSLAVLVEYESHETCVLEDLDDMAQVASIAEQMGHDFRATSLLVRPSAANVRLRVARNFSDHDIGRGAGTTAITIAII